MAPIYEGRTADYLERALRLPRPEASALPFPHIAAGEGSSRYSTPPRPTFSSKRQGGKDAIEGSRSSI